MSDVPEILREAVSDRYAIERELGRGGMATVYLAHDLKHDRPVAIKVLHPEFSESVSRDRFLREVRVAAGLRHAGILPVYDSGEAEGLLYYVMPYVEGESLRQRLEREKQLPIEEALRITAELASALDYAHGQGIVHRDIKPENILFEGDQPRLADFGVARGAPEEAGEKLTRTGVSVGTPHYMSPEQASGEAVDARSDVYALGCVLYELLGGEPPFTGPSSQAILARHALDPVPDVTTLRPTVPEGVVGALEKALAKVPADRYASAGAFAEALEKGEERRRPALGRKLSRPIVAVGAGILVIGALYLGSRWGTGSPSAPSLSRLAVLPFDLQGEGLSDTLLAEGLHVDVVQRMTGYDIAPLSYGLTRKYGESRDPVRDLRDGLHADIVWMTSLDARGDSVWARAELVDAASMTSLGIATIGKAVSELDALVPDLVQWAIDQLSLTTREAAYEPDPEARRAFMRGIAAWWRGFDFTAVAQSHFEDATRIDPNYAEAWGYYALTLVQRAHGGEGSWCERASLWIPAAKEAAQRALSLDSTLVVPHVALGHALWEHEFDLQGARRELERALTLDSVHPDALWTSAAYMHTMGRPDLAVALVDRAVEANPLDPGYHRTRSMMYSLVGRIGEIEEDLRRLQIRWPGEEWITGRMAESLREQGRVEEAVALLATVRDTIAEPLEEDPWSIRWAIARGHEEAADRHIEVAANEGSFGYASLLAYWAGRDEKALEYLERWFASERIQPGCRSRGMVWMLADYPRLIDRPEFRQMLEEVGLPWRESVWARELPDP